MLDRKLLRDVWHLRGQVLAIALVVAAGIVGYAGSLSTYDSLKSLQASYYESARFAHVFVQGKRAPLPRVDRLQAIEGIVELEATIQFDVMLDAADDVTPMTGHLIALPPDATTTGTPRINRLTLMRGAWIDAPRSNQVLVNQTFADARHLAPGDRIGALLNGKREVLQVVGIVLSPEYIFPSRGGLGDEKTFGIFWMGRERLAAAFNMEGAFNAVSARLAHGASEPAVLAALDRELDRYGFTGAYGRADAVSHKMLSQEIAQWRVYGTVLPIVVLSVSVFLLNVALTRQIGTQRSQIAALKALGIDDRAIALHYLKFVLVIVAVGGPIGIAGGAWFGHAITELYARFFRFPDFDYRMQAWIPLSGVAIAMLAAAAGVFNALRGVIHLAPAEAMRPAAPAVYRATLGERLGFGRLYSPAFRMIVRDIERRPLRASMTVFGIAAAVAMMIAGTWWGDAIDYLLDVELRMRDRQAVSIALVEPASSAVLYDLARLPGVLRAEPDRDVVVRFSNGSRTYRTVLSGLKPDLQMRPLLDEHLQIRPMPQDGVVLNERLARRLDVRPGDTVRVQALQGNRAEGTLPVVGLSHELMQMPATMDRDALNRLLGEGDALTGARLIVDGAKRDALLRAVRVTPRIAVATEIGPIVRNVRENSARNILFFTSVMAALAGAIAVGVVYNNARIALAERAWDLASLRVLGFTRGEVSTLLLGELAVEILLALPIGCVIGNRLAAWMLSQMQSETMQLPFLISPATYAIACGVVLGAGVASALVVRRQVDRLDLVAVLKTRE